MDNRRLPTVLAAVVASITQRLRVGTAGVMLSYHSPLKVAEDFRLLELLFPGRIDLGTIRGVEGAAPTHKALLDGRPESAADYESKFDLLADLLRAGTGMPGPQCGLSVTPATRSAPQLWACALSERSVTMAAKRGVGLAYHRYLAHAHGKADGSYLATLYRARFVPSFHRVEPGLVVLCIGCCAESAAQAESIWRRARGVPPDDPVVVGGIQGGPGDRGPDFLGEPDQCVRQLQAIAEQFATPELALNCVDESVESQARQYERLALAAGIPNEVSFV